MKTQIIRFVPAALLAWSLGGCGGNSRPAPLPGPDGLYNQGVQLYEQGRHRRAAEVLQQFVERYAGDPRVPRALLTRGRAHVGARDYVLANADFMRVLTEFGSDPAAREARFALCDSYVRLSPRPALDQEYTRAAISYCESYAGAFPDTPEAAQARQEIAQLRERLARKAYENGMFYYRRRWNDASLIYFNEVVNDYPDTPLAPAALLRLYETYGRMRYAEEQAETRARLLRDYPNSAEARSLPAAAAAAPADSAATPAPAAPPAP